MNKSKVYKRQLDLVKPSELKFPIYLVGAGGIGSWTALALAKLGCSNITVFDFDKVEEHNLPSQIYTADQLGQYKVFALRDAIENLTGTTITAIPRGFIEYFNEARAIAEDDKPDFPFGAEMVILAVDSMTARNQIWTELLDKFDKQEYKFNCFIDGRMGGEVMRILTVNPHDKDSVEKYKKRLFSQEKASKEPCTARSVVYNTFVCGGFIASLVKKYAKREPVKLDIIVDLTNSATV